MDTPGAPLSGIRVIELARILAGPWIGQTLADLGADVIKIESPQGDDTRSWGPPFLSGPDGEPGDSAYFTSCNRGKRSIVIDIASEKGQRAATKLIRQSDVLIENFKVGGLKKYGLDFATLATLNPALIYCSVTGFGQDGPYAHRAGYDYMIQAMSGIMDLTGESDGAPQKMGVAFADIFTGLYGVIAIQAALRDREKSGLGQHIDMALLDSMVAVLANQNMNYLVSGTAPRRLGNAHPNIVPYQVFKVADGEVVIAVGNDGQFRKLCAVLGVPSLSADSRFVTNPDRVRHRDTLIAQLSPLMETWMRDPLLQTLQSSGVPAGPINSVADIHQDPQILFRQLIADLPMPGGTTERLPTVTSPIKFSRATTVADRAPPTLGQHSAEIAEEFQLQL